jgi:hypothetical protein
VDDQVRSAADQRRLLAATIRNTAEWRKGKAAEFEDHEEARAENLRATHALRALANFVEALPDDDADLNLAALRRLDERRGLLWLAPDGLTLLSRFGLNQGTWKASKPSEAQLRNVLRRLDGIEARERRARQQRAEMGYGDE